MKRILPILAVVLFIIVQLLPSLAVPVSAAETEEFEWVNVLDYATMNDSGDNYLVWYFDDYQNLTFTYELPFTMVGSYFDIVLYFQQPITGVSINGHSLSFEKVSTYCYRVYGSPTRLVSNNAFSITVTQSATNGGGWFGVLKFNIGANTVISNPAHCNLNITATNLDQTIYFTGSPVNKIVYSTVDVYSADFVAYLTFTDWQKYDFIDFNLMFHCSSISSVIGIYNGSDILSNESWVNNATLGGGYFLQGRLDLRSIDRAITDNPMVVISGTLRTSASSVSSGDNSFQILDTAGYISTSLIDPNVFWLQRVVSAVQSAFASSGQGAVIKEQVTQKTEGFDNILGGLNSGVAADRPDSSDIGSALDISGVLSPTAITTSTGFLTALFDVPTLSKLLSLTLIFALAATILFGKR